MRRNRDCQGPLRRLAAFAVPALALALMGCDAGSDVSGASAPTTQPYILFAPLRSTVTYLMDLDGQLVHQWNSDSNPACSVSLLEDGRLLRPRSLGEANFPGGGCNGGRVELLDWEGRVVWSYDYFGPNYQQHHDVTMMPNGHVLLLAWETRTADEALAAGRDPETIPENGLIWVDHVVEVDPSTNAIVWVWRAWDHLLPPGADPLEHPELIDPNTAALAESDWTHANSVDYNPVLDQVIVSVRNFSEVWVIDHSTTTAEAAGPVGGRSGRGGDLLYRWGTPRNYRMEAPQQIFGQHNAHWIAPGLPGAGNILMFDNGDQGARPYSTAAEIVPPVHSNGSYSFDPEAGFLPAAPVWRYVANPPESLFARFVSGVQRLPSGNTLVCDGPGGRFLEVTPAGETVWSYVVTDTTGGARVLTFRASRYEAGYRGLNGKMLTPKGPLKVELTPMGARGDPPV